MTATPLEWKNTKLEKGKPLLSSIFAISTIIQKPHFRARKTDEY